MLLTRTELDFLLELREFTKPQKRYIRYKLRRKVKEFLCNELPLLRQKGYIIDTISDVAASNYGVAASSHDYTVSGALVAQPGRALQELLIERDKIMRGKESLGGDSNPRPLPIRDYADERNLTKVTLYQAELPRQLNEQSNQLTL